MQESACKCVRGGCKLEVERGLEKKGQQGGGPDCRETGQKERGRVLKGDGAREEEGRRPGGVPAFQLSDTHFDPKTTVIQKR